MNRIVKYTLIGAVLGAVSGYIAVAYGQQYTPIQPTTPVVPFNASPYNFNNSLDNFNNSPQNFDNSPQNFNNSPFKFNAPNRVYDNNGNQTGYTTTTPDGVTNIYDFNGDRRGYIPSPN
jgi:hypothetical protein